MTESFWVESVVSDSITWTFFSVARGGVGVSICGFDISVTGVGLLLDVCVRRKIIPARIIIQATPPKRIIFCCRGGRFFRETNVCLKKTMVVRRSCFPDEERIAKPF